MPLLPSDPFTLRPHSLPLFQLMSLQSLSLGFLKYLLCTFHSPSTLLELRNVGWIGQICLALGIQGKKVRQVATKQSRNGDGGGRCMSWKEGRSPNFPEAGKTFLAVHPKRRLKE